MQGYPGQGPGVALALLLSAGLSSQAQTPTTQVVQPDTVSRPLSAAQADTIRAIKRLYARHRGRALLLGGGGAALSIGGGIVWSQVADYQYTGGSIMPRERPGVYIGLGALVGMGFGIVGAALVGDFSPRREADLTRRYAAGEPLPRQLRRRLTPRYFLP